MLPYIIVAILCTFFTYLGPRVYPKRFGKILYIGSIFLVCFLSAVRDSTVGTDVQLYGDRQFAVAKTMDFFDFILNNYEEPLYLILTYICSNFFNRYVFYFVLQLLVFLPLYSVLLSEKYRRNAWVGVLIYFLWLYSYSLNLLRQSIAISILIYGLKYIINFNNIKYYLLILISMGFHVTGIIGIIPLLIYKYLVYQPENGDGNQVGSHNFLSSSLYSLNVLKRRYHNIFSLIYIFFVTACVYFGAQIIIFISNITGRYSYQVSHISGDFNFNARYFICLFLIFVIIIYMLKISKKRTQPEMQLYVLVLLSGIILFQLMGISFQMYRISLYFTSYMIFFIPQVFNSKRNIKSHFLLFVILILLFYLFYQTVIVNTWNEVYPYTSEFLGII